MYVYICPAHLKTYKHVIYYLWEQKPSNYLPLCYKIQGDNIIHKFFWISIEFPFPNVKVNSSELASLAWVDKPLHISFTEVNDISAR